MTSIARLLALIPLRFVHALGAFMGWLIYWADARYAQRLRENLQASGIATDSATFQYWLRRSIAAAGKAFLEIFVIWFRAEAKVLKLVREVQGWEHVEAARAAGKGVILLTPHLGCFEIAGLYSGSRLPFTELYRPPKFAYLEPLMRAGRARGHIDLATTDYAGVKKLLAALRRGEAIGALPDQVPSQGDGAWAAFFGRPAYTMTLMSRLQQKTGAAIICFYAQRLDGARGYNVIYRPPLPTLSANPEQAARQINAELEAIIRACPEQYLWSYNRYKGTPPAAAVAVDQ